MSADLRKHLRHWVMSTCFTIVSDQLKALSDLGVVLKVVRDGERYRQRFFPVPLYLSSDIQEDWFLGAVGASTAHDENHADLRTLATVDQFHLEEDHWNRVKSAGNRNERYTFCGYDRRTEAGTSEVMWLMRTKFEEAYARDDNQGAHYTKACTDASVKIVARTQSVNAAVVFAPEHANSALHSDGCEIIDWYGKGDGKRFTYARLPYEGFSRALGVDSCELFSPDPLHVLSEGIIKEALSWIVKLIQSHGPTIKWMNNTLDEGSWIPHHYLGRDNLPTGAFTVLTKKDAIIYGVHRDGLAKAAQVACLANQQTHRLIPLFRALTKLLRWAQRHHFSDDDLKQLAIDIEKLQRTFMGIHADIFPGRKVRNVKLFQLSQWPSSIVEKGALRNSDTAGFEAQHSILKQSGRHTNGRLTANQSSEQLMFHVHALCAAQKAADSVRQTTSRESAQRRAIRTEKMTFPTKPLFDPVRFTAVEGTGNKRAIAANPKLREMTMSHDIPDHAADQLTAAALQSLLQLPRHAKLVSVDLSVRIYDRMPSTIHPSSAPSCRLLSLSCLPARSPSTARVIFQSREGLMSLSGASTSPMRATKRKQSIDG